MDGSFPQPADNYKPRRKGSGGRRAAPSAAKALENARKVTTGVVVPRPKTYSPELCDEAIALGAKGFSRTSIAHCFGVPLKTLIDWERDYAEFSDALARAYAAQQHWWEVHGQKNLKAKHYQAQVWARRMAASFPDYRDKPQATAGELVDFLTAVIDAAGDRKRPSPGDGAKVIGEASTLPAAPAGRKREE